MDDAQKTNSKAVLRKQIIEERNRLDVMAKKAMDDAIFERLYTLDVFQKAMSIFVFLSSPQEVNTDRIVQEALSRNKVVCAPKVIPGDQERIMHAYQVTSLKDVTIGSFGIREPIIQGPAVRPQMIDMVIVPGLAFTAQGARLGYGGGYYDRYLQHVATTTELVGVAYDMQMVSSLPVYPHDHLVHTVITPTCVYSTKRWSSRR